MAKRDNPQQNLFEPVIDTGKWKPPSELPDLSASKTVWQDNETNGKDKHKSEPCGLAIATEDRSWYFPFRHLEGGNMDEAQVKRWAKDQLRNKRLANINMGFDAETTLNWGVDLEAQGCSLHDIAHSAALIDEEQFKGPNLNELAAVYFPGHKKMDSGVRPENIHKVHSSLIGPYAINDIEMARGVDIAQRPFIERDDLGQVEALEDELIWPNNHMERNGMRLDMPKLGTWREQLVGMYAELAMKIWMKTGVKLKPNSADSWHELFHALGLTINWDYDTYKKDRVTKFGFVAGVEKPSGYTEDHLKPFAAQNEYVKMGLRMRRLSSLQTKYLDKYWKAQKDGVLYYSLYQLRASEEDYGTVVGRYSSANVNIQQVFKCENQVKRFGDEFIIRELMIPDDGFDLFAVDGSQLQFRAFAHYSDDASLQSAYRDNPDTDFHQMVADLFGLDRQSAKHNNFAMVLGMGREKLANRIGKPCQCELGKIVGKAYGKPVSGWQKLAAYNRAERQEAKMHGLRIEFKTSHVFGMNENHDTGCQARESNNLADQYERDFPAAQSTMEKVTEAAKGTKRQDAMGRGYIQTLSGRRQRYVPGDKYYSAFAGLLQGVEADLVKSKINTLYKMRKQIGIHKLRAPVHDEVVGDISKDPRDKKKFEEACNDIVELEMKVPMVWDAKYGPNWKDMNKPDKKASGDWYTQSEPHSKGRNK